MYISKHVFSFVLLRDEIRFLKKLLPVVPLVKHTMDRSSGAGGCKKKKKK